MYGICIYVYVFSFQTRQVWNTELNRTEVVNLTVAKASTTELRSDPLYSQVGNRKKSTESPARPKILLFLIFEILLSIEKTRLYIP